jgi:hypothetical protein
MADGTVGVAESASPTKYIDNEELTVGAHTVERQRVRLAGASAAGLADLFSAPLAGTEVAVPTRSADQFDTRYDYTTAGGKNVPQYVGWAQPGTATSTATWTVTKYTWALGPDGSNYVPTVIETRVGAWDSRATLNW